MQTKFKILQVAYAINVFYYNDPTYAKDFYRVEEVIIDSIYINSKGVSYMLLDAITKKEWGDFVEESLIFINKELASKELIKLCKL